MNTEDIVCCKDDCLFLSINEKTQDLIYELTGHKPKHYCLKYNKILTHYPYREPYITRCPECLGLQLER
jgi:hypothetical protein